MCALKSVVNVGFQQHRAGVPSTEITKGVQVDRIKIHLFVF